MSDSHRSSDPSRGMESVRISLASPENIRSWSSGEVTTAKLRDTRTGRPAPGGLFCERIFGPLTEWQCACGKCHGREFQGMVCENCGVVVADSHVRSRRMGHVELAVPIVHPWFFGADFTHLSTLLKMTNRDLEQIIYFSEYVVIDPGRTPLVERQLLARDDLRQARENYGDVFEAEIGAAAIKKLLARLDPAALARELRAEIERRLEQGKSGGHPRLLIRRLAAVEALRDSGNRAEWMVLECIPILPPDLRLVQTSKRRFGRGDLNRLYRDVIRRNNLLKMCLARRAPNVILHTQRRLLQEAVDRLFDNCRCRQPARMPAVDGCCGR